MTHLSIKKSGVATTPAWWVKLMLHWAKCQGLNAHNLCTAAGIDASLLVDTNLRIEHVKVLSLWRAAADLCEDESLGLKLSEFIRIDDLNSIGCRLLASPTLDLAFGELLKMRSTVFDSFNVSSRDEGNLRFVNFEPIEEKTKDIHFAVDSIMSCFVALTNSISRNQAVPVRVELGCHNFGYHEKYKAHYRAPVIFKHNVNRLAYRKEDFYKPLLHVDSLFELGNVHLIELMLRNNQSCNVSEKTRQVIINLLPRETVSIEIVARRMNMSARTLQRRLHDQGTVFRDILDISRKDLAKHFLEKSALSIQEISYFIGFTDPSNFNRSCRRWFGKTPNEIKLATGAQ